MQLSLRPSGGDTPKGRDLYGCDIETVCNVPDCGGFNTSEKCEHALDFNRNRITVIGVSSFNDEFVFRDIEEFKKFIIEKDPEFTFHNGAFDFKSLFIQLQAKGYLLSLDRWKHDSLLLAFNYQNKIPLEWLESYNSERLLHNKNRTGIKHREAGLHSLKTLAPYFLGVDPFWEPEHSHNDDEYVLKDTRYTLHLTGLLVKKMKEEFTKAYEFYLEKHLPWTKNLVISELLGIKLDMNSLGQVWMKAIDTEDVLKGKIETTWASHFEAYLEEQRKNIEERYFNMAEERKSRNKFSEKVAAQYERNKLKALERVEPLNLDSPSQLKWLLSKRLNLEVTTLEGEESTGVEVLERLSQQNEEVGLLLQYRKARKLITAFFPSYYEKQFKGIIYPTFNSTGTRTGRLSASRPNLQQVPGHLHSLFIAREGQKLITQDLSGIEPVVLAYYSEDDALCELLLNNGNFHDTNVIEMFEVDCEPGEVKKKFKPFRDVAKTVGLAVLYGAGANRVLHTLKQEGFHDYTFNDAKRMVYRLRDKYKGVWEFKNALDKELESGTVIYNLLGRPLKIADKEEVYMKGLNTLIQSSASDIVQEAAFKVRAELDYQPLLLVHDELVTEVPEDVAEKANKEIEQVMTTVKTLETKHGIIPIKVEGSISKIWQK